MVYSKTDSGVYPVSVAVSAPKRLFKRAVDRNLLKRRMREAYRLNKHPMLDFLKERNLKLNLLIQYTPKDIRDYKEIEKGVLKGFELLQKELLKQASLTNDGAPSQPD